MDIKRALRQVFENVENNDIWRRLKSLTHKQNAGQTFKHLADDAASKFKNLTHEQDSGQMLGGLAGYTSATVRTLKNAFHALDFERAFKLMFAEPSGVPRLVVGGLIFLTPVAGQLSAIGYMLEIASNVASGNPRPLPDWKNFADKVTIGGHGLVIVLAYLVPLALVVWLLWALLGGTGLLWGFVALLLIFAGVAVLLLMLASLARYVQSSSLETALQVGQSWHMVRAAPHLWLVLAVWAAVCGVVACLGAIGCIFGFIFTVIYALTVFGHLLGQTIAMQQRETSSRTRLLPSA